MNDKADLTEQDRRDYIIEREGIRIYSGGMSEAEAMREAQTDLDRYLEAEE